MFCDYQKVMKEKIISIGKIPGKKDLEKSLMNNRIPIKFCYPDEGGNKWDILAGKGGKKINENYSLGKREETIIKKGLSQITQLLKFPFNIIHIGVGNGRELPYLVKFIDFNCNRYFGIDISKQMIKNTINYQSKILNQMSFVSFILTDVESKGNIKKVCRFTKQKGHNRNLLLIIGQGVLSSNSDFHKYVLNSLEEEDYVLYSLEGDDTNKRKEICETYNMKEVHDLLKIGLRMGGIINGKFLPAQFNEENNLVELYFQRDNGKKILCLTSYKPSSKKELVTRFENYGFNIISINFLKETHTYSFLCNRGKNV